MEHLMPADNTEARRDRLIRDYHAYNAEIETMRTRTADFAREKVATLLELRKMYSVAEIAKLLGVTRQAIYNQLGSEVQELLGANEDLEREVAGEQLAKGRP